MFKPATTLDDFHVLVEASMYGSWLVDQLSDQDIVPVVKHYPLDIPAVDYPIAFWAPQEYMIQATTTYYFTGDMYPRLVAPPDNWLSDTLPRRYSQRYITTVTVKEFKRRIDTYGAGFYKPAGFKCPDFPAQWITSAPAALDLMLDIGLPSNSHIQISDTYLDILAEFRCFCVGRSVKACSSYLGDPGHRVNVAKRYAQLVLDNLSEYALPPAFVMDVAYDSKRGWLVVEANPAWSSNPYDCESEGVVQTVLHANLGPTSPYWQWEPDPYLMEKGPSALSLRSPVWHDRFA